MSPFQKIVACVVVAFMIPVLGAEEANYFFDQYKNLTHAWQHYKKIEGQGGWPFIPSGSALRVGSRGIRVSLLRKRLAATGELKRRVDGKEHAFDSALSRAVVTFQKRNDLTPTGIVDEKTLSSLNISVGTRIQILEANLDRWRWLPLHPGPRYVFVDIAGYHVYFIENGAAKIKLKAMVGGARSETPIFWSQITQLELNPSWYVPRTIALREVLPGLQRDAKRVAEAGIQVLEVNRGRVSIVSPTRIHWKTVDASHFPYQLRQLPGPDNPLGRLKFFIQNPYDIFLHGTPEPGLFESDHRAVSHGCVRVETPIVLALALLKGGRIDWTQKNLEERLNKHRQEKILLPSPVPIFFNYLTAWSTPRGQIEFRRDIYGWDEWDRHVVNSVRFDDLNQKWAR